MGHVRNCWVLYLLGCANTVLQNLQENVTISNRNFLYSSFFGEKGKWDLKNFRSNWNRIFEREEQYALSLAKKSVWKLEEIFRPYKTSSECENRVYHRRFFNEFLEHGAFVNEFELPLGWNRHRYWCVLGSNWFSDYFYPPVLYLYCVYIKGCCRNSRGVDLGFLPGWKWVVFHDWQSIPRLANESILQIF